MKGNDLMLVKISKEAIEVVEKNLNQVDALEKLREKFDSKNYKFAIMNKDHLKAAQNQMALQGA